MCIRDRSEIYEKVTGNSAVSYYAFAIIILTIANIMSIIGGALLNALGEKHPSLTGDKKTLLRKNTFNVEDAKEAEPTFSDMCGAIMVIFGSYALGQLFAGAILPTIAGAPIHEYAYMILFVVILSATGVIPKNIRAGAKRLQKFMNKACAVVMMAGLGFDFDLGELVAACTVSNVIIALFIVIGAIVGSALVGQLVGFYPIDSAITAGLCMANRGGNGDVGIRSCKTYGLNGIRTVIITTWWRNCTDRSKLLILILEVNCNLKDSLSLYDLSLIHI